MVARDLISDNIPPVKIIDELTQAADWMHAFKVYALPIIKGDELIGILHDDDLLNASKSCKTVEDLKLTLPPDTFVYEDTHVYEILRLMTTLKLDIIPVLNSHYQYLGLVTRQSVFEYMTSALNAAEPGGLIVLRIAHNSYSLSEIGRICESADAKVLSLTLANAPEPSKLLVTIKLNLKDITRAIALFEHFQYDVARVVFDAEKLDEYRENYEALLKYLNP